MKSLVIFDSMYGNTSQVAHAIGGVLGSQVIPIEEAHEFQLDNVDLLIVGCPTQGGKPTVALEHFLEGLPATKLASLPVAVFDTRFAINEHGLGLKLLMKTIGFAAPRLGKILTDKGAALISAPQGFIVKEKSGPLKSGELARARSWAQKLPLRSLTAQPSRS